MLAIPCKSGKDDFWEIAGSKILEIDMTAFFKT